MVKRRLRVVKKEMIWEKISKTEPRCFFCRIEKCEKSRIQELGVRRGYKKTSFRAKQNRDGKTK